MSGLLILPNFPNTNGMGTEALGKGVDTVTGLTVTPDGTLGTPAQIRVLVEAALVGNGNHTVLGLYRPPNQI
jgi:hypothetical protein